MDQRLIELYDDYVHRHFDRRQFLSRAGVLLGSTAAASAALTALQSNYAQAAVVEENDPRIVTERVTIQGGTGPVKAYLAKPKDGGKRGAILVIHQNRGLNPHILDVTRRFAADGYVALGVDFLSPQGGTPDNDEAAMKLFPTTNADGAVADARAAVAWLKARPDVNGKVGAVGYCWGGGMVGRLAVAEPTLDAGVVYYGPTPAAADVAKIKAPLLLNYADVKLDERIGAMLPGFEEALKKDGVKYTMYVYEGAQHAFNDDTAGPRYHAEAAKVALGRTMAFFKANLS